jgi:DNA-binding XRE family transcriptional regulator
VKINLPNESERQAKRIGKLTPMQTSAAHKMRSLRKQIGMSTPAFAKIIGINSPNITLREMFRVPWRESELQTALPAVVSHLRASLDEAEAMAKTFSNPTQPNPQ